MTQPYEPTAEEIKAGCEQIQATWTKTRERVALVVKPTEFEIPRLSTHMAIDKRQGKFSRW